MRNGLLFLLASALVLPLWGAEPPPKRIVVADGALTEIIHALGAADRIVGVDTTSLYPVEMQSLPNVGYLRALSAEGVLSLTPDLLLTTHDAGPANVLEQLRMAGVKVEVLSVDYSMSGTLQLIQQVGTLLSMPSAAGNVQRQVRQDIAQAQENPVTEGFRVLFVLNGGSRGLMVSGHSTRAHALIDMVGAQNVAADFPGYKPLTNEAALLAAPDAILVLHANGDLSPILQHPALMLTPAVQHGRVFSLDETDWLTFGPRLGEAIIGLTTLLEGTP